VKVVKASYFNDLVLVKGQVLQLGKLIHAFHFLNQIETEVQPGQVDESVESLNLGDDVIV
jgi:hypothetical protein